MYAGLSSVWLNREGRGWDQGNVRPVDAHRAASYGFQKAGDGATQRRQGAKVNCQRTIIPSASYC
jgi:hypothetical protein